MSLTDQITTLEAELVTYIANKPAGMGYQTFLVWNKGVTSLKAKITRRERKLNPIMPKANFDRLYAMCYAIYSDHHVKAMRLKYTATLSEWQDGQLANLEAMIWRTL